MCESNLAIEVRTNKQTRSYNKVKKGIGSNETIDISSRLRGKYLFPCSVTVNDHRQKSMKINENMTIIYYNIDDKR